MNFPLNILTLPIWWYSQGFGLIWDYNKRQCTYLLRKSGLIFLANNLFKPLYQDYTRSGKVLSFFLRIFLLIYKSFYLFVAILFLAIFNLLYLAWLPCVLFFIFWQIFSK